MIIIQYPEPDFKTKNEGDRKFIFDSLRKKWVVLTPEEWVRQNFVRFLVMEKKYPAQMIAIEKEIRLGELKKRFDLLLYDLDHKPWMLIECKSMEVALNEAVLEQVTRYHIVMPAQYLIITNGKACFGFLKREGVLVPIEEMPFYPQ